MPTNVVSIHNSKKHMTNAEKKKRLEAEEALSRKEVSLAPPDKIKKSPAALEYWQNTIERMKDITLLDDVDIDILAIYCELMERRDKLQKKAVMKTKIDAVALRQLETIERTILSYAEKLGLTPTARARLAKKRVEKEEDPNGHLFS